MASSRRPPNSGTSPGSRSSLSRNALTRMPRRRRQRGEHRRRVREHPCDRPASARRRSRKLRQLRRLHGARGRAGHDLRLSLQRGGLYVGGGDVALRSRRCRRPRRPRPRNCSGGRPVSVRRPWVTHSGRRLVCHKGAWSSARSYAYNWYVDGSLRRETSPRPIAPVPAYLGHRFSCKVTAYGPGGSTSAMSPHDPSALGDPACVSTRINASVESLRSAIAFGPPG